MQHQYERLVIFSLKLKVRIGFTPSESQLHQVAIDPLILCSGCLLQPIESLLQPAYMRFSIINLKFFGLLHVDLFFDRTMQECSLDIHLM